MNTFLGVVLFCMNGQCAFWKSEILDNKLECEAVTVKVIDTMVQEKAQLVQGVCFSVKLGKPS